MSGHLIDILMATYNGAPYVSEQIDSLLNQTEQNWKLLVRDDGSVDGTEDILKDYAERFPNRISILRDDEKRIGPSKNFFRLLGASSASYTMFCDQDDVWLPNKIEVTLSAMKALEAEAGVREPCLVHTDLEVVDKHLNRIHTSLWKYQGLNPLRNRLGDVLVQNNVTGCACMVNKTLRDFCFDIPDRAIMHDWWLALVAAAFGRIEAIAESTILYRQHGKNDTGAHHYSLRSMVSDSSRQLQKGISSIEKTMSQADAFADSYGSLLPSSSLKMTKDYVALSSAPLYRRLVLLTENRFRKHNLLRTIAFYALVMMRRKEQELT